MDTKLVKDLSMVELSQISGGKTMGPIHGGGGRRNNWWQQINWGEISCNILNSMHGYVPCYGN